jgi:hypothetical protein
VTTPVVTDEELARGLAVLERELGLEKAKAFLVAVSDRRVMAGASGLLSRIMGAVAKDPQKAVTAAAVAAGGLLAFQALQATTKPKGAGAFPSVFQDGPGEDAAEVQAEVIAVDGVAANLDKLVLHLGPGEDT